MRKLKKDERIFVIQFNFYKIQKCIFLHYLFGEAETILNISKAITLYLFVEKGDKKERSKCPFFGFKKTEKI